MRDFFKGKKFLVVLLATAIMLPSFGGVVFADEGDSSVETSENEISAKRDSNLEGFRNAIINAIEENQLEFSVEQFNIRFGDEWSDIYNEILDSHPEYYYMSDDFDYNISYDTNESAWYLTDFILERKYTVEETATIESVVRQIYSQIDSSMTDYQKALFVHDWIVLNTEYGGTDMSRYNIYGILGRGIGVCQGYAETYEMLLERLGIQCDIVTSRGMDHAWNVVLIGGEWYHVDCTWDDPLPDYKGYCYHDNFLRSDAGIQSTRHYGWESSVTCSSTLYDEDFADSISEVYYNQANDSYYYLVRDYETRLSNVMVRTNGQLRVQAQLPYYYDVARPNASLTIFPSMSASGGYIYINDATHIYRYDVNTWERIVVFVADPNETINEMFVRDDGTAIINYYNSQSEYRTVHLSNTPIRVGIEEFAERLYTGALGRTSEAEGKAYWISELSRGASGSEVAYTFLFSDEVLGSRISNSEYVKRLYRTFMGREGTSAEVNYWATLLGNSTYNKDALFWEFASSDEWINVCNEAGINPGGLSENSDVRAFATRLYTTCLKRDGDPAGINYWTDLMVNGSCSGTDAAKSFFFSDEFISQNTFKSEFVRRLYLTFMGREASADEINYWINVINYQGREAVFYSFARSNEFAEICRGYGIRAI